jgi:DNA polymerase IV
MAAREKRIAHFDLDSFFVSVERLYDPALSNKDAAGKMPPVAVGGSADRRGVIASASYEAREYGVRSAMPVKTALRLCPRLIVVKGRHGTYSDISSKIIARLRDFVPVIEQTSIDEGYMDFTGCEKLYQNDFYGALRMLQRVVDAEFRLPISFGMGSTRVVAKIASDKAKPRGILVIAPGQELEFLGNLEIREIPGVGPKTGDKLYRRGFTRVSQIQRLSPDELILLLGKHGEDLHRIVNGTSSAELTTDHERKSISSEETFPRDMSPSTDFASLFAPHIEEICYRLRGLGKKARTVTVKIRYEDFSTMTRSASIPATSDDTAVNETTMEIFSRAYDGRTPVRLIGVGLSNFTEDEPGLFEPQRSKRDAILQTVDAIRKKHGLETIHVRALKNRK